MAIHKDLTGETATHPFAYKQSSDPGAVGAGKGWIDTTTGPPYQLKVRNSGNTAWETVGITTGASAASETTAGIAEIATTTETNTGTDDARIVTPAKLAGRTSTDTRAGVIEIATQSETDTGTDDARAVTPAKLAGYSGLSSLATPDATETVKGKAEIATQTETNTGTDDARIVTPLKLKTFGDGRYVVNTGGLGTTLDLDNLGDVTVPSPSDGEVLTYDSGSGDWVNEAPVGPGGSSDVTHWPTPESGSASITASTSEVSYLISASGASRTVTGYTVAGNDGRLLFIKKTDSSANTVTFDPAGSETVNGASTLVFTKQNEGALMQADADNNDWVILARPRGGDTLSGFGGYVPDWVAQTGATSIFAARGAGDPVLATSIYSNQGGQGLVSASAGGYATNATAVMFRLPVNLSLATFRMWANAATTGVWTFAIYPVGTGSSKLWDSGAQNTATGWNGYTSNLPVTIDANTNYWMAFAATSANATSTFYAPTTVGQSFWGANASPLGGRSIGLPVTVQFSVTSGSWPSTLPAVTQIGNGAPTAFLEGTPS